jgi:hypothetical protein
MVSSVSPVQSAAAFLGGKTMRRLVLASPLALAIAAVAFAAGTTWSAPAEAVVCAKGVYRAGCAGPNGAVGVRRPPPAAAGCRHVNGRRVCGVVR